MTPPSRSAPSPTNAREAPPHGRLDGVRILVVEGDDDVREVLRLFLEEEGATVHATCSTEHAWYDFREAGADALLVDVSEPGDVACGFIAALRALGHDAHGDVPAIAFVSLARRDLRAEAVAKGFTDVLTKPFGPDALLERLATLIGR